MIKHLPVDQVQIGMVIARDVYTRDDQFIIPKDTELTARVLSRLHYYSVNSVMVYDGMDEGDEEPETEGVQIVQNPGTYIDLDSDRSYTDQITSTPEFQSFKQDFDSSVHMISEYMDAAAERNVVMDKNKLYGEIEEILDNARNELHMLDMMNCMRDYDDLTYAHSVNVSLLCHAMGEWLGYEREEQEILTLAGLVHDIGKLKIPEELIKKPDALTRQEFAIVRRHPVYGYEILRNQKFDLRVINAALMHHERCDGKGYPRALSAEGIDNFAKIVAVADVYEAMTADRVYRKGICPFDVLAIFERDGFTQYDPQFLLPFMNHIVESFINMNVELSDGRKGRVVMLNQHMLSKPVIKLKKGFVDLSKEAGLRIRSVR